jgi:hypothetical protein
LIAATIAVQVPGRHAKATVVSLRRGVSDVLGKVVAFLRHPKGGKAGFQLGDEPFRHAAGAGIGSKRRRWSQRKQRRERESNATLPHYFFTTSTTTMISTAATIMIMAHFM